MTLLPRSARRRLPWIAASIATAAFALPPAAHGQSPVTFQIAFQSNRDGNDSDLWLVNSDGTGERPLTATPTPEASPSWSPDATTIVYACAPTDNWELCAIDVATRESRQLTKTPADEFDPRYTGDGTQIVFETYSRASGFADIAIMPADGGDAKLLTATPGIDDQDPAPDPGGSQVAFSSKGRIALADTENPGSVKLLTFRSRTDTDPSFSGNGAITFAQRSNRSYDVAVVPSGGGTPKQLTSGSAIDVQPAWAADADQIFFARSATPERGFRIFRTDANGSGAVGVTKGASSYDDTEPAPGPAVATPAIGPGMLAMAARILAKASAGCNVINGTSADNTRVGGSGNDCIFGRAGNDSLYGAGGNDRLTGGIGNDRLYGQTGNDELRAVDGQTDQGSGGSGNDQAYGDAGETFVSATSH